MVKSIISLFMIAALLMLAGCPNPKQPRLRISSYFGSIGSMQFTDPAQMGSHSYNNSWEEKNGMLYTCRAGFIDVGHLREGADRTYYAYQLVQQAIMDDETSVTFSLIEPSEYHLTITYPSDWRQMSRGERQMSARRIALKLGPYIAHRSMIWHEMITWYGFSSVGLFSEYISAFSWEDPYSDALGIHLASRAIRKNRPFDQAMTSLIAAALKELEVQSPLVTMQAFKKVEGQWFEGGLYFFVKMNKRNFDVGFENGWIVPWLVPQICPQAVPEPCPVPKLTQTDLEGFVFDLQLDPRIMEKGKIYADLELDGHEMIRPAEHFPILMDKIKDQAIAQYGNEVDLPVLNDSIVTKQ
jgi:hypothetical protein